MKTSFITFLCLLFMPVLAAYRAQAGSQVGSTITYQHVVAETYTVNLQVYRNCDGSPADLTHQLNLKAPGCNPGRNISLNLAGSSTGRNPYCASVPVTCAAGGLPRFEILYYTGTVTFSAAEQYCTDWILSAVSTDSLRPLTDNIATTGGMYNEAYLKLLPGLDNSSPQLSPLDDATPVLCTNKWGSILFTASDAACDSLSYTLVAPLSAPNTPVTYKPVNMAAGSYYINPDPVPPFHPTTNPQFVVVPNLGTNFRPDRPFLSFDFGWGTQQVVTGRSVWRFYPSGYLGFSPVIPANTAGFTNNYAVVVEIKEWRKVNGTVLHIGTIRRELQVHFENCGSNKQPNGFIRVPPPPGSIHPDTTSIFEVRNGTQLVLEFEGTDPDAADMVTMETDLTSVLPGAQLTYLPGTAPNTVKGTITWLASAFPTCDQPRYFRVRFTDNACSVKGKTEFMAGVKVVPATGPLAVKEAGPGLVRFQAFPNPFTDEITFKYDSQNGAETILIHDLLGREIDRIPVDKREAGKQEMKWENAGKHKAGSYIAKLISADKTVQTLKFTKLQ